MMTNRDCRTGAPAGSSEALENCYELMTLPEPAGKQTGVMIDPGEWNSGKGAILMARAAAHARQSGEFRS